MNTRKEVDLNQPLDNTQKERLKESESCPATLDENCPVLTPEQTMQCNRLSMESIERALLFMNEEELGYLIGKALDRLEELDPTPEEETARAWDDFCKRCEEEWNKEKLSGNI